MNVNSRLDPTRSERLPPARQVPKLQFDFLSWRSRKNRPLVVSDWVKITSTGVADNSMLIATIVFSQAILNRIVWPDRSELAEANISNH